MLFRVHLFTEVHRYYRFQKLSSNLEELLTSGNPLPSWDYDEGELSILANQIQIVTLRLMEASKTVKEDQVYLAEPLADISYQLRTSLTATNLVVAMLRSKELSNDRRNELARKLQGLLPQIDWLVESLMKRRKLDAGTVKLSVLSLGK